MRANARITAYLKAGVSVPAVVICCALACAAQAQTRNFSYPDVPYSDDVATASTVGRNAPVASSGSGLQMLADPLTGQDEKFAARPSPYANTPAQQSMPKISVAAEEAPVKKTKTETDVPAPVLIVSKPQAPIVAAAPALQKIQTAHAEEAPAKKAKADADVPAPVLIASNPPAPEVIAAPAPPKMQIAQAETPNQLLDAAPAEAPAIAASEPATPAFLDHTSDAPVASAKLSPKKAPAVLATAASVAPVKVKPAQSITVAQSDVPAPVLVVQNSFETPVLVSAPHTEIAANAAHMLADSATARASQQTQATFALHNEFVSLVAVEQQNAAAMGSAVGSNAAATQLALNDSKSLSELAPAAGPVPGGALEPVPTMPVVAVQPVVVAKPAEIMDLPPVVATPPMPAVFAPPPPAELSSQSRAIVHKLPPEKPQKTHTAPVKMEHFQKNPLESEEVRKHDGIGISISVRRPKPNISHMLEQAYDSLMAGNQEEAVDTYKEVLKEEPENKLALFGLATTYHRAGQLNLARPLYGKLLAIDPKNEEGLNNFLVLLGDEAPGEALSEMKKLEKTHPGFSPLPAQMAVIYEKMGEYDNAIANMKHAIELSPENIKYRYDMGVMMDRAGDWQNAAVFYEQLIIAADRGEKIPAREEEIQERLTFIRSNKPKL